MTTRGVPHRQRPREVPQGQGARSRRRRLAELKPIRDWAEQMDWTGTRMRLSGKVGALTLSDSIIAPYQRGDPGVVDFVTRYATEAITRRQLERILIYDGEGRCLGEVLPPAPKTPF